MGDILLHPSPVPTAHTDPLSAPTDRMKLIATRKADQNRAVLDPWTVVHFATGLAAGLVGMSLRSSVAAAVAYEFAEQYAERQNWGQEFFQTSRYESISNAVVDVVVFAAGHQIGKLWNDTGR